MVDKMRFVSAMLLCIAAIFVIGCDDERVSGFRIGCHWGDLHK